MLLSPLSALSCKKVVKSQYHFGLNCIVNRFFAPLNFVCCYSCILRRYFPNPISVIMSTNKILKTFFIFFNHLFVIQFIFLTRIKILSVLTNNMKIFNYIFEEFTFCRVFVTEEICFVIFVFSSFCSTLNRGTGHFQKVCFRY